MLLSVIQYCVISISGKGMGDILVVTGRGVHGFPPREIAKAALSSKGASLCLSAQRADVKPS